MTKQQSRTRKEPSRSGEHQAGGPPIGEPSTFWIDARGSDEQFRRVLLAAIERGEECAPTQPSSRLGTRAPISNYTRDD